MTDKGHVDPWEASRPQSELVDEALHAQTSCCHLPAKVALVAVRGSNHLVLSILAELEEGLKVDRVRDGY